jgi:hypothetical protein
MNLRKIFGGQGWKPREGLVYKSWTKGDSHFGKSATVKIVYEDKEYIGTFRVKDGKCEIRIGKGQNKFKLITPSSNVSFNKNVKHIDSIWSGKRLGQNGYYGTDIQYTAKIIDPKIVEIKQLAE